MTLTSLVDPPLERTTRSQSLWPSRASWPEIGGLVAFPTQFPGTGLAGDLVVLHEGQFLVANADDDPDFTGGSAAGEDNEIAEFIAMEGILVGGDFG